MSVKFACPKCGSEPGEHGKGGHENCQDWGPGSGGICQGFLCGCDDMGIEGTDTAEHGTTQDDPCRYATCWHCGWVGVFPPQPFKLKGWAKTAWDEGWRPPSGWQPKSKVKR